MRIAPVGRAGIVFTVAGVALLVYSIHSLAPHSLVALDIPISLAPGRITTGDFNVDPESLYHVEVEMDRRGYTSPVGCEPRSVLRTQWTVSSDGDVVDRGSSPWDDTGLTIADLYDGKSRYALDVTVFPGASCLNAGSPRLKVRTHPDPSDLYTSLIWLSLLSIGCGFVLFIRSCLWEASARKPALRIFPGMILRNVFPLQRHRPMPLLRGLPDFGLFCGSVLFILIAIFMIFEHGRPSKGLLVKIELRDILAWQKSPSQETLGVYVDGDRRFYVNGHPVPKEELRTKLSEELAKRIVGTVYFEADDNCEFADAAYSIDTIQGLGARVIWITPQVREELNRETIR
jgi:biopolymer transport protein ExbD